MKKKWPLLVIIVACVYVTLFLRHTKRSLSLFSAEPASSVNHLNIQKTTTDERIIELTNDFRTKYYRGGMIRNGSSIIEKKGETSTLRKIEKNSILTTNQDLKADERETDESFTDNSSANENPFDNVRQTADETTGNSFEITTENPSKSSVTFSKTTKHFPKITEGSPKPTEDSPERTENYPETTANYPKTTEDSPKITENSKITTKNSPENTENSANFEKSSTTTENLSTSKVNLSATTESFTPTSLNQQETEILDRKIQYCNPDSIYRRTSVELTKIDISCVPIKAPEKSCSWAEELYHPDDKVQNCDPAPVVEICRWQDKKYRCSLRSCLEYQKHDVLVWKVNDKNGKLEKFVWFNTAKELEKSLVDVSQSTLKDGHGFLLLQCVNDGEPEDRASELGQLLILQPSYRSSKPKTQETINLNFVLLDSVSRSHFYRSLPKTIETFENINRGDHHLHTKAEVLDFELFQAIAGHTNHVLHGLFTGKLFPSNATKDEKQLVDFSAFFKNFAMEGYRTVYHDDMCYDSIWGLRLNLGTPKKWKDFKALLKRNYIHSTGLTFSSCRLLHHNGVPTPFSGPRDRSLCYNGRFMDSYHLTFNHLQHQYSVEQQNKLLTFNVLCVGHDDQGTRIQSIDQDLASFAQKMSKVENTLTLIFADHGNTYTPYATGVQGRHEQFHPSLFMIVPEGVQKSLGKTIMKNLRENQFKLVTIMDLHKAFVALPRQPTTTGIFGKLSNQRTCDDLPLVLPNFCVCQNWSQPLKNDSSLAHIVHFAVGKLNEEITSSQKDILQNDLPMKCKLLVPERFNFITERITGKTKIISFDFEVSSGNIDIVNEKFEKFHVEVESVTLVEQSKSLNLKLVSFDRISPYGPYRACSQQATNIKLCICDNKSENAVKNSRKNRKLSNLDIPNRATLKSVRNQPCLMIHQIVYPDFRKGGFHSITYHLVNNCRNTYHVVMLFSDKLKNLRPFTPLPFRSVLLPHGVAYMGNVVRVRKAEDVVKPKVKVKAVVLY